MFNRLNIVFFVFVGVAGFIVCQLVNLQIVKGDVYKVLALGQQVNYDETQGGRGDIFLNKGALPLTQARYKNFLYIFPDRVKLEKSAQEISELANILKEKPGVLSDLIQKGEVVKREISDIEADALKKGEYPFLGFERNIFRFYPQQRLAANVVGFVDLERNGQYGVEGFYNNLLSVDNSFSTVGRAPLGFLAIEGLEETAIQRGADLWLTLDYNIQYFAEKLLKQAKEQWDIDEGQIVVEEPQTGRILALATWPNFDPNEYGKEKGLEIFVNPVVQKAFEPGSVFKPITMAAGIQEGLVTAETKYVDKGYVDVGGPLIYNFGRRVWGEQTMEDVLEESINTGAVFVEDKLGKDLFLKYVERFGFFEKTNIDLQGEVVSLNDNLKHGYPRDFASASFGQGIEITPIQLIRAFGAIANGGKLMRPYLVEKIIRPNGEEELAEPKVDREVISKNTASALTAMLEQVVEAGSARRVQIKGYRIAGKTGTAQVALKQGGYSEDQTVQSFMGFFPAQAPRFLVFVKLDNPKGVNEASRCAVPLARDLIKNIIDLKQIPPTENIGPVSDTSLTPIFSALFSSSNGGAVF